VYSNATSSLGVHLVDDGSDAAGAERVRRGAAFDRKRRGSYFDFAAFSFQVPANDSGACAATEFGRAAAMSTRLIRTARRCADMFVTSWSSWCCGVECDARLPASRSVGVGHGSVRSR
jgi:hypothetical protein